MNTKLGALLKIVAALCSTLMLASVKGLQGEIPTGEIIFFRSFFALLPLLIWIKSQGNIAEAITTNNILGHIGRGFSGSGGMFFSYIALVYISLTDATALSYTAPIFTVILAAILLKESVHVSRWVGVLIGFAGIIVMLADKLSLTHSDIVEKTGQQMPTLGILFALLAAGCSALSSIQIRFLNGIEKPTAIVFYFSLMTMFIGLLTLMLGWRMPTLLQLMLLIGCGVFGGLSQIMMTLALKYADASLLAPFDYTSLIWSMLIGYYLFDSQTPTVATLIGASIVAVAGTSLLWHERRRKRRELINSTA